MRLAALASTVRPQDLVVSGRGSPVGCSFLEAKQAQLAGVADLVRELHAAGVPVERE